jgi:molybdenum cofactor cytidylyltransferase
VTVAGAVLAAGAGVRFARSGGRDPKARAELHGEPLVARAVRAALGAGLDEVVVVQGSIDLSDLLPDGVVLLPNPDWSDGIATSLAVAVRHAKDHHHDALVVGLADQPGVTSAAWRAVAAAPPEPPIAVATYQGQRANPVRLGREVWPLLPESGDAGARVLLRDRPDLVREVPCTGAPWDVDTVEDLDRWS